MPVIKPFVLEPCLVERIWGTKDLGPWYPAPASGKLIGEVWLTAEDCNLVGGSGTLADATEHTPKALGDVDGNGFPLLLKMLYPRDWLSVQVHPKDAQARALGEPRGKTECWYVLQAEPGATVALGFKDSPSSDTVSEAIAAGTLETLLQYVPVSAGDMVFVEANTVHAIGPGVVVFEVQQYSDVTYRLYDYGRPRELHLNDGLAVVRNETRAGLVPRVERDGYARLVECEYFAVDRFSCTAAKAAALGDGAALQIVVPLHDGCTLTYAHGETLALPAGAAAILPSGMGEVGLHCVGDCEVLRVLQVPA